MNNIKNKHIGCYGFIIKDKKIALIKKARGGYKGMLDLPGGGMEHYETPIETLHRELNEEAGVKVIKEELIDITSKTFKWQMKEDIIEELLHIGILYKVEVDNYNVKEIPDGEDSYGCKFYKIEELHKKDITPFTIYGLEKLGYKLKP